MERWGLRPAPAREGGIKKGAAPGVSAEDSPEWSKHYFAYTAFS